MQIDLSERWEETDHPIYFYHNFTEMRAHVDFRLGSKDGHKWHNDSIPADES